MPEQYSVTANFLDESFNGGDSQNYGLSVVLNESYFSSCILDFRRNKYLGLHHFERNDVKASESLPGQTTTFAHFLEAILVGYPWLKGTFKQVKIAYEGNKSTLIPATLFNQDEKEQYLNFNHVPESGEMTGADHLVPMDAWQVYAIPGSVGLVLDEVFPNTRVIHGTSVLIESIWINYKNRISTPHIFLHLRERMFDLVIFDGRELAYFNTFSRVNSGDVAYYLIFVMEQLGLNPEKVPLVLLGNAGVGYDLSELLHRYVRHVETILRNEAYNYSYVLNHLPPQSYFPLLNFFSCGL